MAYLDTQKALLKLLVRAWSRGHRLPFPLAGSWVLRLLLFQELEQVLGAVGLGGPQQRAATYLEQVRSLLAALCWRWCCAAAGAVLPLALGCSAAAGAAVCPGQ